jgi:hypothetical protein
MTWTATGNLCTAKSGCEPCKDEFEKVAAHNEHHLEQIAQALRNAAA